MKNRTRTILMTLVLAFLLLFSLLYYAITQMNPKKVPLLSINYEKGRDYVADVLNRYNIKHFVEKKDGVFYFEVLERDIVNCLLELASYHNNFMEAGVHFRYNALSELFEHYKSVRAVYDKYDKNSSHVMRALQNQYNNLFYNIWGVSGSNCILSELDEDENKFSVGIVIACSKDDFETISEQVLDILNQTGFDLVGHFYEESWEPKVALIEGYLGPI